MFFCRDDEIDLVDKGLVTNLLTSEEQVISPDEAKIFDEISNRFSLVQFVKDEYSSINSPDHFVAMDVKFRKGDPDIIGSAVVIVDCEIENVVSLEYFTTSRKRTKDFYKYAGIKQVVERINNHRQLYKAEFHVAPCIR